MGKSLIRRRVRAVSSASLEVAMYEVESDMGNFPAGKPR